MNQRVSDSLHSSGEHYLFVYGTLRPGFGHPLNVKISQYGDYLGEASINGRLYRVSHYPGLVLSQLPEERVTGDVYRLLQPDALLAVLDE